MGQSCCQKEMPSQKDQAVWAGKNAIYLNSECMGDGDRELGRILMTAFFETLSQDVHDISHVLLVNSAVKLACEGSPVLKYLQDFQEMGVAVLSCGTCLKHYELMNRLKAGDVSNMVSIVETMKKVKKTISP